MDMIQVNSSNLEAMGYSYSTNTLTIRFKRTGDVYEYQDVPVAFWNGILNADSKGQYFNAHIMKNYEFVKR